MSDQIDYKVPFIDRLIMRLFIPLALVIAAPAAGLYFDAKTEEVRVQTTELRSKQAELQLIIERQERLEEAKAAELAAMSSMVVKLDDTLKTALVQMTVLREMRDEGKDRGEVVEDVTRQVTLPGVGRGEVKRLAGEAYDRLRRR